MGIRRTKHKYYSTHFEIGEYGNVRFKVWINIPFTERVFSVDLELW